MDKDIFYKKDLYLAQFSNGVNFAYQNRPPADKLLFPGLNIFEAKDMKFTETNGFPILSGYNGKFDYEYIPFTQRRKYNGENQAVHFFLHDSKFRIVWRKLDQVTYQLQDYQLLSTPDYSLGVDIPDFVNKEQIYKSRFVGAYWQIRGYQVLPTASWGNANSFSYCFEGLPENSIIAVCGVGHHKSKAHLILWQAALKELEMQKHPTLIIVYGEEETVPGLNTPLFFIPCFISKRFRK